MSLEDLARSRPFARPLAVPDWTLGCFKRRCITYATGVEDTTTEVIWIQSHGLTGDLRVAASRPRPNGETLAACSPENLAEIAKGDGFAALTSWDGALMAWDAFAVFQPYEKWPEPGRLERVGASLIEWAPSCVYVEDWRLQPGSEGLSVGLRLECEIVKGGDERPREGALVIAGEHALRVIGRRAPLPVGRAHEMVAASDDPAAFTTALFDCEVSYARRKNGSYEIERSVDPFLEGAVLFDDAAFRAGPDSDILMEKAPPGANWIARRWRIDTLLADQVRPAATPAALEALAWLASESGTLVG